MTPPWEKKERARAIEVLSRAGAARSIALVRAGKCYTEILKAAWDELGGARFVALLVGTKNAQWMYFSLRDVPKLAPEHRRVITNSIIESKHPHWSYCTLYDTRDLSADQRKSLKGIVR